MERLRVRIHAGEPNEFYFGILSALPVDREAAFTCANGRYCAAFAGRYGEVPHRRVSTPKKAFGDYSLSVQYCLPGVTSFQEVADDPCCRCHWHGWKRDLPKDD